jgi:hypothetical protein
MSWTGSSWSSTPSDAAVKARNYGRVQNRLLLGNRAGMEIQVLPDRVPDMAGDGIAISMGGLTAQYLINNLSYVINADGMVASVNACFWGALGATPGFNLVNAWTPTAPGLTALPTPPATTGGTTITTPTGGTVVSGGTVGTGPIFPPFNEVVRLTSVVRARSTWTRLPYALTLSGRTMLARVKAVPISASGPIEEPELTWDLVRVGTRLNVASGDFAPVVPAAAAAGDLLVCHIAYRDSAAFTAPTGGEWTIHEQQSTGNTSTDTSSMIASGLVASCVRGSSNPNTTFTRTGGDVAYGCITVFRPSAGTVSFVDSSSATLASAGTVTTTSELTTTTDRSLLITTACGADNVIWNNFSSATTPTIETGFGAVNISARTLTLNAWEKTLDEGTITGADTQVGIAVAVKEVAGATGDITATAGFGDARRHAIIAVAFEAT